MLQSFSPITKAEGRGQKAAGRNEGEVTPADNISFALSACKFVLYLQPPTLVKLLLADFRIIFERDPSAGHWIEALLLHSGFHALCWHRLAHWLHLRGIGFLPRFISHLARWYTGVEIHPGAAIGKGAFIAGGGVVIGETTIIGDFVAIYQNSTLGGTGKESGKRHPTLGNNVTICPGAKVLGNIEIGDRARVEADTVVLRSIPSGCAVMGVPGKIVAGDAIADAKTEAIRAVIDRLEKLEKQVKDLQVSYQPSAISRQLLAVSSQPSAKV